MLIIFETFFRHSESLETKGLTHFMLLVAFYIPRKYQKTRGFLMFLKCKKKTSEMKWSLYPGIQSIDGKMLAI